MPIRSREDFQDLTERVTAFFDADPDGRAHELRRLFVELMDFHPDRGSVSLRTTGNLQLPDSVERIAELDDVRVYYLPLQTKRVTQRDASAAARQIADLLGEDMLLVCTNHEDRGEHAGDASQLHLIHPLFHPKLTLRRMVIERGVPQRTAVQQVSNIYWEMQDRGSIGSALRHAFDVEPVTKEFFRVYERLHERALGLISGVSGEEANQFVQTLFNRLMFIYFLSRKGWLRYEGDTDYLNALWDAYEEHSGHDNFYYHRLSYLFFEGLNKSAAVTGGVQEIIGDVPFLNGGLFEEDGLDKRAKRREIIVPDAAVRPLLTELFDKFNFTVMESTPLDIEVAVDPEMLGKVFEELVTGRHSKGAYYTPRPVVSFMCREALKGYLESKVPVPRAGGDPLGSETADRADPRVKRGMGDAEREQEQERERERSAVARFVDERSTAGIGVTTASQIAQALAEVTVVDPACGSGAYLLGMMHELVELQELLFNVTRDAKSLYELKLEIIQRNLYGVDLDEFAVNIAMLRLWLSLAIDYDGERPEPLPNLDFKILQGDSLLGPNPTGGAQQAVLGYDEEVVRSLGQREAEYFRERAQERKPLLRDDIRKMKEHIRSALDLHGTPKEAIEWRVDFPHVFLAGGFDVVIGNPPYAQIKKGTYSKTEFPYSEGKDKGKQNLYKLFTERSYQLCRPGGTATFIVQSSLMCDLSSAATRELLLDHTSLRHIIEFPKDAATPSLQVFQSVTQGTCIYQFSRSSPTSQLLGVSVGNDASSVADPAYALLSPDDIRTLYPTLRYFPLVTQEGMPALWFSRWGALRVRYSRVT